MFFYHFHNNKQHCVLPLLLSIFLLISIEKGYCIDLNEQEQSNILHVRTSSLHQQPSSSSSSSRLNENNNELIIIKDNNNNTIKTSILYNNTDPCLSLSNCTSCYDYSSKCHWCGSDEKCHSKGSIHGCLYGKSCDSTPPPDANDTRCNKVSNCTECGASYFGSCHWCEFDNKCHAKGSVYGCIYGVDCYSNTRCQRQEPEFVYDDGSSSAPVSVLLIVSIVLSVGLCCCTICFCVVRYTKGAYDDLTGLIMKESIEAKNSNVKLHAGRKATFQDGNHDSSVPLLTQDDNNKQDNDNINPSSQQEQRQEKNTFNISTTTPSSSSNQNANYIFQTFKTLYILSIITLIVISFTTIYYYPAEPEYNFCNNEFDWKSIISGMTSFKMEASFQMLASVYNPNHFDIEVTSGSGVFYHDGAYVGHFEIPNNTIASAKSINDYLVMATFTPDKWQALSLTTEFFKGTLTFVVQATLNVIIPGFDFYVMNVNLDDFVVHVNDMSDRHLCSCSTWDSNSTAASLPMLR